MRSVPEKKNAFFDFFVPIFEQVNNNILESRTFLKETLATSNGEIIEANQRLTAICKEYLKSTHECKQLSKTDINKLMLKVDVIPPSLGLAQAANESSWGSSRFAIYGRNYFGEWCYSKGCGLVPRLRAKHHKHEVKRFHTALDSVTSYARNLNTNSAYAEFRRLRSKMRLKQGYFTGRDLVHGLKKYSQKRGVYVKLLQQLIRLNKLERYDKLFWKKSKVS